MQKRRRKTHEKTYSYHKILNLLSTCFQHQPIDYMPYCPYRPCPNFYSAISNNATMHGSRSIFTCTKILSAPVHHLPHRQASSQCYHYWHRCTYLGVAMACWMPRFHDPKMSIYYYVLVYYILGCWMIDDGTLYLIYLCNITSLCRWY